MPRTAISSHRPFVPASATLSQVASPSDLWAKLDLWWAPVAAQMVVALAGALSNVRIVVAALTAAVLAVLLAVLWCLARRRFCPPPPPVQAAMPTRPYFERSKSPPSSRAYIDLDDDYDGNDTEEEDDEYSFDDLEDGADEYYDYDSNGQSPRPQALKGRARTHQFVVLGEDGNTDSHEQGGTILEDF